MLQIHYGQSEHSVEEGSTVLSSLIYFQFRTNQNSFNIARSPVTVDAAEAMGLGFFKLILRPLYLDQELQQVITLLQSWHG